MITTTRACLLVAALGLLPSLASALNPPDQGTSMDQVRKAYGNPVRDMGAVGKPPITRWVYDGFTVYFENRQVIHTVRTQALSSGVAALQTLPSYDSFTVYLESHKVIPTAPIESLLGSSETLPTPQAPTDATVGAPNPGPETFFAPSERSAPKSLAVDDALKLVEPESVAALPSANPEPAPASEAAPALVPAPPVPGGGFRFDLATGRLIIDGDAQAAGPAATAPAVPEATAIDNDSEPPPADDTNIASAQTATSSVAAQPEPAAITPKAPATAPKAPKAPKAKTGTALDGELEFDPETGTFRPRQ